MSHISENNDVQAENTRLQQQVAELQHQLDTAHHLIATYQAIIDQLPDVVYAKDPEGNILLVNDRYCRVAGMNPEQTIGKNQAELFPPEWVEAWKAVDRQLLATGEPTYTDNTFYLDGLPHIYNTTQFPLFDEHHNAIAICAVSEDITERKYAEDELIASKKLLQLVIDNMPLIVYITDLEGNYTLVNRFAALLMNMEPQDIIGKNQLDLFPPEVVAAWEQHNQELLEAQVPLEREEPLELPDGVRTNLSIKFPIFSDEGNINAIGGISMDITERKRQEMEQIALQDEIIQAQKQFVREMSTPLMPIADGILAMPIVGRIDSERAMQIMETLLEGVAKYQAEITILDITGVHMVDTQIATALIQSAKAVKLLGATVILSGISPLIAQTLVHLGVDFSDIVTCSTFQTGIAYAMQQQSLDA